MGNYKHSYSALILGLVLAFNVQTQAAACDSSHPETGSRDDILIVVNDNSLDSCEVGLHYAIQRDVGKTNIAHVAVPPSYWLNFSEFRSLRDQIIKHMQQPALLKLNAPDAPVCTDGDVPYYCQASMDHLRQYTKIRYLVTTRGIPTRTTIDGSTLKDNNSTSIDNYLSYWLVRYFSTDTPFNFKERETAFKDGRGMRIVDPAIDGELIVGRLAGINRDSTLALIDRIMAAEKNGLYGKHYGSQFGRLTGRARWYDYSANTLVYGTSDHGTNADSWRYQLGLFGESRPECIDYLNNPPTSASGKAPQDCLVRFSETTPGTSPSRTPLVDDALIYLGSLHGHACASGDFQNLLNWVRDPACSVKLCEDHPDPAACRANSTDVFREINTDCVGVADGFIGYNYQSFPVSYLTNWPTGWHGPTGGSINNIAFPSIRDDTGFDDTHSLWFGNTDRVVMPLCYSGTDFTAAPSIPCRDERLVDMYQTLHLGWQTVDTVTPQQFRIGFWYRADNVTAGVPINIGFLVYEPDEDNWIDYGVQTVASVQTLDSNWVNAEKEFLLDPARHTNPDPGFDRIKINISTGLYTGDFGFDAFSIKELTGVTELALNTSFTEGYKSVSSGDFAATYLNRLNGVAFWGSASHHESGGHSFSQNPMETILYFLRGLPLGDAVWWGEIHNSGIFYGDPVYSPVTVKLNYLNDWDAAIDNVALSGSTINGRDPSLVSTGYEISYCADTDFYLCDQIGGWISTGISGPGGQEDMPLGTWDTSSLTPGDYVLRLMVTSTNPAKGRSQSLYDYYPVTVYDRTNDDDGDGLANIDEITIHGTNPALMDSDGDSLTDGDEVNLYFTNPVSTDTDEDGLPDGWELANSTDPKIHDSAADPDQDGLDNLGEFNANTDLYNPDTDADRLSDGDEVNVYLTNPNRADTDLDHLQDGEEVFDFSTDPNSYIDLDKDGMADDWELVRGADPGNDDARIDADSDGVDNIIEYYRDTLPLDAASKPILVTIHVDASTSGLENGTAAYPYNTLIKGISAANYGDTVQLASGTYQIGIVFTYSKPVRIIGPEDGSAILSGNYFSPQHVDWGDIINITVSGYQNYISNSRNIVYRNCVIATAQGTLISGGSKSSFINCAHQNTGTPTAISIGSQSDLTLVNNTIAGFNQGIDNRGGTVTIRNSILSNSVDLLGIPDGSDISYTLISDGQFASENGNITGDPLFINAVFNLDSSSPAVDAGDPLDNYQYELEPNGCRINMGVYGNTAAASTSDDPDLDLVYGYCDLCPGTPTGETVDTNGCSPSQWDSDNDGVTDDQDNCILIPNSSQLDTNGDGFGNHCDADFNNNLIVDPGDFSILKSVLGSTTAPDQDLNGNGVVDPADFSVVKASLGQPPGPSCCATGVDNTAPVLDPIGNQSVDALATLSFTAIATDNDLPANTLTFSLDAASLALGMSIDPGSGAFSWSPNATQAGTSPAVTLTVTDDGTGNLSDSETFTITVNALNTAPVLATIGNQSVDALATLSFTAIATDDDTPANTLTFSLDAASLALGMSIDPGSGAFSWSPNATQAGTSPAVTLTVTDDGTGNLSDSETFTITVNALNTAPVLATIGNQSVDALATLSFTATATDDDTPANTLTFSLDAASLALGMSIDPGSGAFSWSPDATQAGTSPAVTLTVTDDGTGNLSDSETFTITVNALNTAPVLATIGNQSVDALATLSFTATATDDDTPANTLTFSLDAASLALGMSIDPGSGAFSWSPNATQAGTSPAVTLTVTDDGTGNLSDSETFTITVNAL